MNPAQRKAKQKAYRQRRFDRGICQRCKNKRMRGKVLCEPCTVGRRYWQRKYIGAQPWREGGRGRPPKYTHTEDIINELPARPEPTVGVST